MSERTFPALHVGEYLPSPAFHACPVHVAVAYDEDNGLVAVTGPPEDADSEVFARLFAAAPDLLEACRRFVATDPERCDCDQEDPAFLCRFCTAREAIGKAEGSGQ